MGRHAQVFPSTGQLYVLLDMVRCTSLVRMKVGIDSVESHATSLPGCIYVTSETRRLTSLVFCSSTTSPLLSPASTSPTGPSHKPTSSNPARLSTSCCPPRDHNHQGVVPRPCVCQEIASPPAQTTPTSENKSASALRENARPLNSSSTGLSSTVFVILSSTGKSRSPRCRGSMGFGQRPPSLPISKKAVVRLRRINATPDFVLHRKEAKETVML